MTNTGQHQDNTPFLNVAKFSEIIETMVIEKKIDYLDAIITFCDDNDIPHESINKFVSTNLKEKLEQNFIERGMIKGRAVLPL